MSPVLKFSPEQSGFLGDLLERFGRPLNSEETLGIYAVALAKGGEHVVALNLKSGELTAHQDVVSTVNLLLNGANLFQPLTTNEVSLFQYHRLQSIQRQIYKNCLKVRVSESRMHYNGL